MEVLNNYQRKKLDETNDEEFYSEPKFVYHLDQNFRQYPISRPYYKNYLNRISDKGLQLGSNRTKNNKDEGEQMIENILNRNETTKNEFPDFGNIIANDSSSELRNPPPGLRIIINKDIFFISSLFPLELIQTTFFLIHKIFSFQD